MFLDAFVEWYVHVEVFQLLPLVQNLQNHIGREQSSILGKENEQQAVKQLLRLLEQEQLPLLGVLAFRGRVVFQYVGKEYSFELGVVLIESLGYLVLA